MNLNKIITVLIITISLFGCSSNNDCSEIKILNNDILARNDKIYSNVNEWNTSDIRMNSIKKIVIELKEEFIKSTDKNNFTESKSNIDNILNDFIQMTKFKYWKNIDYLWIIKDAKEELKNLNTHEICFEYTLNKILSIEEKLISTFYLMGYNDNYCFNKVEPIIYSPNINTSEDSISFIVTQIAYDSSQCTNYSVSIENEMGIDSDSIKCYPQKVPRVKGINNFKGVLYYNMYGKHMKLNFNETITIK